MANALKDRPYCYNHDRLHRVLTRQTSAQLRSLVLRPLEDRRSVFFAISDVLCALAAKEIDSQDAARLLYGLRIAGKYAPESSDDIAGDAGKLGEASELVESVEFTKAGDELAPVLELCTDDDHCETCCDAKTCDLEKAVAWRAEHPAAALDEEDDEEDADDRDVAPASLPAPAADPSHGPCDKNEDRSVEDGKEIDRAQTEESDVGKNAA